MEGDIKRWFPGGGKEWNQLGLHMELFKVISRNFELDMAGNINLTFLELCNISLRQFLRMSFFIRHIQHGILGNSVRFESFRQCIYKFA